MKKKTASHISNMTLDEIFEMLGITRQNLSKWKSGSLPSIDTMVRISELFHISLYWLATGKESDKSNIQFYKDALFLELDKLKHKIELL